MNFEISKLQGAGRRYFEAQLTRTYINMDAVFSDETKQYLNPYDPLPGDTVTFRLRTARDNIDSAYLHAADEALPMVKTESDELFDYYSSRQQVCENELRYHYSLEKDGRRFYYNKQGLREGVDGFYNFKLSPVLKRQTGLRAP